MQTRNLETLIPTRQLSDGMTNNSRLKMRLTASKYAHERRAEILKTQSESLTGATKLAADTMRLEHLRQVNFIQAQLNELI